MPLPDAQNRREAIERIVGSYLTSATSREAAFARLAEPLARLSRTIMTVLQTEDDPDRLRDECSSLSYTVENIAAALLAIIEVGQPDPSRSKLVRDVDALVQALDRIPRGGPVWHEQTGLRDALEIWTADFFQDIRDGMIRFDAHDWSIEVDAQLLRGTRDCVELSALLRNLRSAIISA